MGFKSLGNWLKVRLRSSKALNFLPSSSADNYSVPTPAGGARLLSSRNRQDVADFAHEHGWRVGVRGRARKRGEGRLHTKWKTPVSPAPDLCSDQRALLQRKLRKKWLRAGRVPATAQHWQAPNSFHVYIGKSSQVSPTLERKSPSQKQTPKWINSEIQRKQKVCRNQRKHQPPWTKNRMQGKGGKEEY